MLNAHLFQGTIDPATLDLSLWLLWLHDILNLASIGHIKHTVLLMGGSTPLFVALLLCLMLIMLFLQKTCLLEGRVRLTLELQEATDYLTDLSQVGLIVLVIEAELICKELVLLFEDRDVRQSIG